MLMSQKRGYGGEKVNGGLSTSVCMKMYGVLQFLRVSRRRPATSCLLRRLWRTERLAGRCSWQVERWRAPVRRWTSCDGFAPGRSKDLWHHANAHTRRRSFTSAEHVMEMCQNGRAGETWNGYSRSPLSITLSIFIFNYSYSPTVSKT